MARTARKTAEKLIELYEDTYAKESYEPFRINWDGLRGIAGVDKLHQSYLRKTGRVLDDSGYFLLQFDSFLVILQESDMHQFRLVPSRVAEKYRFGEEDDFELDEDEEDDEIFFDDENIELDDDGDADIEMDEDVDINGNNAEEAKESYENNPCHQK